MIVTKNIILRDFIEADIEKRIYWETVETEWQFWDGPWEYEGLTEDEKETGLLKYIDTMHKWVKRYQTISENEKRDTFQIVTNDAEKKYIGWVSSYRIDDDCNINADNGHCTVGIDLPDISARGKGYAYQALCVFINYLLEHGEKGIYIQTWSGNERMIHIAQKIGFKEYHRKVGIRSVRGKTYDDLTFQLDMNKFKKFLATLS